MKTMQEKTRIQFFKCISCSINAGQNLVAIKLSRSHASEHNTLRAYLLKYQLRIELNESRWLLRIVRPRPRQGAGASYY